jgi:hypothetical protein
MQAFTPSGILAAPKEEIVSMVSQDIDQIGVAAEAAFAKSDAYKALDQSQMNAHLKTVAAFFSTDKWAVAFAASQERLEKAYTNVKEIPQLLKIICSLPDQFAIDAWGCSNVLSLGLVACGHRQSIEYNFKEWSEAMDEQMHLFHEVQKTAQVALALE